MPSLTKKIIRGKPYYYLRECQRVAGKPKIVSTIYLGPPQNILDRLMRPQPAQLAIYEFGASAAVWDMAQAIDLLATMDRHVPKRASQGPSVGQYMLLAAFNRCIAPCSKAIARRVGTTCGFWAWPCWLLPMARFPCFIIPMRGISTIR